MVDTDVTIEVDYSDGFREGFLQGYMAGYISQSGPCEDEDCPRKRE